MALVDVATNDIITSARINEENDIIEQGTQALNTSAISIASTAITSGRNIATAEAGAHNVGTAVHTTYYGIGTNLSGLGGGGQNRIFEAIVAPAGGDYTTIGAAITAGKKSIFVRKGTYNEAAITSAVADLTIVGESMYETIIDYSAGSGQKWTMTGDNLVIENLTIYNWAGTTNLATFDLDNLTMRDVYLSTLGSDAAGSTSMFLIGNTASSTNFLIDNVRTNAVKCRLGIFDFGTNAQDGLITNCLLTNTYATAAQTANVLANVRGGTKIINNTLDVSNVNPNGATVDLAETKIQMKYNIILRNGSDYGILLGANLDDSIITSNTLVSAAASGTGVFVTAGATNNTLTFNLDRYFQYRNN